MGGLVRLSSRSPGVDDSAGMRSTRSSVMRTPAADAVGFEETTAIKRVRGPGIVHVARNHAIDSWIAAQETKDSRINRAGCSDSFEGLGCRM